MTGQFYLSSTSKTMYLANAELEHSVHFVVTCDGLVIKIRV